MDRLEAMNLATTTKVSHTSWKKGFFELTDRGFTWDNGEKVDIPSLPYEGYAEYTPPPPEPKLIEWFKPILSTEEYKSTKWYTSKESYISSHTADNGKGVIGWLVMNVFDRAPENPLDAPEIRM